MKVGVAGAGNIGMGYASLLTHYGHEVCVWSPSGKQTEGLRNGEALIITGALEGSFNPTVCTSVEDLANQDVIVLALPAYCHRSILDRLSPLLEERHFVIISSHLSFSALYLSKILAERGLTIPIVAWSTTIVTCKPRGLNQYNIGVIRDKVDMATLPARYSDRGLGVCITLFGDRFALKDDLLTIALSNLNPPIHVATALCNLTRIESAEPWGQNRMLTPTVGRLIEAMDLERVAVATALGKTVRTVFDHYRLSYDIAGTSVSEIALAQADRGRDPVGPDNISTRWITEDVPFGIVPIIFLASLANVPVPLHQGALDVFSGCYGRMFTADNDLLPAIGLLEAETITALMTDGYRPLDPACSTGLKR